MIDLGPLKYDNYLLPIVECLKYSPLVSALTKIDSVPMSLLSKAYSSASYIKEKQRITFEVHNRKTSITKSRFFSVTGLAQTDDMIDPESVTNSSVLEMFYQMGYMETLTAVSKFSKPNLPPKWNGLFTLLFKAFSERVIGSNCASKLFMTIIYGVYTGLNIDFGAVLWAQVTQSTHSTSHHSQISYACFWTIIVQRAIDKL